MIKDWQELSKIVGGKKIIVERVKIIDSDISIEGQFDLPPFARLTSPQSRLDQADGGLFRSQLSDY